MRELLYWKEKKRKEKQGKDKKKERQVRQGKEKKWKKSKQNKERTVFQPVIPRCGSYEMLPYGVPFDSLSFLYLTSGHFFDFKNLACLSRFFDPSNFLSPGGGVS